MRIPGAAVLLNPVLQMDHGLSLRGLWVFAKLSQVLSGRSLAGPARVTKPRFVDTPGELLDQR